MHLSKQFENVTFELENFNDLLQFKCNNSIIDFKKSNVLREIAQWFIESDKILNLDNYMKTWGIHITEGRIQELSSLNFEKNYNNLLNSSIECWKSGKRIVFYYKNASLSKVDLISGSIYDYLTSSEIFYENYIFSKCSNVYNLSYNEISLICAGFIGVSEKECNVLNNEESYAFNFGKQIRQILIPKRKEIDSNEKKKIQEELNNHLREFILLQKRMDKLTDDFYEFLYDSYNE